MSSDQMTVAALGRSFTLGDLYDAYADEVITGLTLLDNPNIKEENHHSSSFYVSTSDSIAEKSSLLDIDASMKASFLAGMIEVGGSAKFLNDKKKLKNQSRVTLQYKATTKFKKLSISCDDAQKMQTKLSGCSATHVVTGILYGANAFFVFDSEKLDASNVQEVQGEMQATIKKIPKVEVEGGIKINLSDKERELSEKLSCSFHGDFHLKKIPSTFKAAVETYMELPSLLKESEGNGVPLKVTLTPLKIFFDTAEELKGEICQGLLRKVQNAMEDVRNAEIRCTEYLEYEAIKGFPIISDNLKEFLQLCSDYTAMLRRTMKEKFPAIRAGKEKDASVEKLFDDRKMSPFSSDNLENWMEKEVDIIQSYGGRMIAVPQVTIVLEQSDMKNEGRARGVDHVLCFVFTLVEKEDPFLKEMTHYLHSHHDDHDHVPPPAQQQMLLSGRDENQMRKSAEDFINLAKGLKSSTRFRFLVSALPDKEHQGGTIYHFRRTELITRNFSKPDIPDVETLTDKSDLMWYACDLTLDPKTVNHYLSLSEENKKASCGPWQTYDNDPERFDKHPQVMCSEGLKGRHYWEVEWNEASGNHVGVAVTYNRIGRKGNGYDTEFGSNTMSWYFGEKKGYLTAYHSSQAWSSSDYCSGRRRFGVFLDWPEGTLSFYSVYGDSLTHHYTFHTTFTEPVHPAFWVYSRGSYAALSPIQ
ncbi:neoverrucotoxin subunit alpha-like [Mugil cephalus]|uniref:neoverrucotoxin subunit alpha-like n=1 Tax=Mugil cephalus TaxID=48193 RepID=UPI001FB81909|nr:neoverrucotoxin subunit alpha-like [Mugil cephalus]